MARLWWREQLDGIDASRLVRAWRWVAEFWRTLGNTRGVVCPLCGEVLRADELSANLGSGALLHGYLCRRCWHQQFYVRGDGA